MRYLCRLTVEKDFEFIARMKTGGAVDKSVKRRNDKYFILNKEFTKVLQSVETNFNFKLFCCDSGEFWCECFYDGIFDDDCKITSVRKLKKFVKSYNGVYSW